MMNPEADRSSATASSGGRLPPLAHVATSARAGRGRRAPLTGASRFNESPVEQPASFLVGRRLGTWQYDELYTTTRVWLASGKERPRSLLVLGARGDELAAVPA